MNVISTDVRRFKGNAYWELQTFWQKIAHALDRLLVDRSYRAVPATALRRAKHDRDRCRRLMHQG
jgi:hypothetical protein